LKQQVKAGSAEPAFCLPGVVSLHSGGDTQS
jgi:hypothetical protein